MKMFKNLLNFEGINWWTLVAGLGANFVATTFIALAIVALRGDQSAAGVFESFGLLIVLAAIFLICGLVGYIIAKIADDQPLKHALWASMGSAVPFVVFGVLLLNPNLVLGAAFSVLGALNGGMFAIPKPHYRPPRMNDK
jgi:hypothetical protein